MSGKERSSAHLAGSKVDAAQSWPLRVFAAAEALAGGRSHQQNRPKPDAVQSLYRCRI
jgi:hypothetical protein